MKKWFMLMFSVWTLAAFVGTGCSDDDTVEDPDVTDTGTTDGEDTDDEGTTEEDASVVVASAENDFVYVAVKNLSAVSVDVEVTKSDLCTSYAIGAVLKYADYTDSEGNAVSIYDENTFIQSCERSLNPDSSYPYRPYNTSDSDGVFTELTLSKASAQDDVNTGIVFSAGQTYVVGVYAIDEDEEGHLLTLEFTVPEVDVTKGEVEVSITVEEEALTSVTASFSASEGCAKIITAIAHKSTLDLSNFDDMTDTEKEVFLTAYANECPQPYTGSFTKEFKTAFSPGTDYVISAIPVDAYGNIGKVTYYSSATATVSFNGEGKIMNAEISQSTYEYLNISLTLNAEAKQVRLLCMSATDYSAAGIASDLDWIMYDANTYSHYWTEYDADEVSDITVAVSRPGQRYYIKAVTVDADGEISEVQDVVMLAEGTETYATLEEVVEEEDGVSLNGIGEVEVTYEEGDGDGYSMIYDVNFTVTKDENVAIAYRVLLRETLLSDVEEKIKENFANYPTTVTGSYVELSFDGDTATTSASYLDYYDNNWGGTLVVFVTVDLNGDLNISKVYSPGLGVVDSGF